MYLNNNCSRHMTRERRKLYQFKEKENGFVSYDDNNKNKILEFGEIGTTDLVTIKYEQLMEG